MDYYSNSYISKRLTHSLKTFDPETHRVYPIPLVLNLSNISNSAVKLYKSLFNKMYEMARKYNIKIVFSNLIEKIKSFSTSCNHMLQSCQPVHYHSSDLLQKFTAIENQTKHNKQIVEIVLN